MNQNEWPLLQSINTLGRWLEVSRLQLNEMSDSPALETQMIAAHVLGKPRAWVLAHPEEIVSDPTLKIMNALLNSLKTGQPLAYLTGEREFYGRSFIIRPGVLVPRPETELLVDTAILWLKAHPERRKAVDVGCGSGCIAVTLAAEIGDLLIDAVDIEALAIKITVNNSQRHSVTDRVNPLLTDLLPTTNDLYHLICANLPYIPSNTLVNLPVSRFEPVLALDGGLEGLRLIERLLELAVTRLHPGGLILLEIEASQGDSAPLLARRYFPRADVQLHHDLAGLPRLVAIQNNL
jgi:release factor glutamine methyltransferase